MKQKLKFSNISGQYNINFLEILRWLLTKQSAEWPKWVNNTYKSQLLKNVSADQVAVTFVNHATCLIQTNNKHILTDPVWSYRVSPLSFVGPKRVRDPGIAFNELPTIDMVVISHNHYDHLDIYTLKKLEEKFQPIFIVPLGNRHFLEKKKLTNVHELNWWETFIFNSDKSNFKITLVPAQHFSGRWLHDRDKTLWGGYVLESRQNKVFFAGDTGYASHFKQIYEKFGAMDISLLPIGSYEPRYIMKEVHMNPEEAVQAHVDLQSKLSIPIHFGTFQLTDESIDEPILRLTEALKQQSISADIFKTLLEGETIVYDRGKN
jgi:L-ascorbate metabolism protein UlaG (beta-lactamase superfamily)